MQITSTQREFVKILKQNNLGEYHDLYVQSNTDVFENFRNTCLEIYKLDSARFFTAPGLAWEAVLKRSK